MQNSGDEAVRVQQVEREAQVKVRNLKSTPRKGTDRNRLKPAEVERSVSKLSPGRKAAPDVDPRVTRLDSRARRAEAQIIFKKGEAEAKG